MIIVSPCCAASNTKMRADLMLYERGHRVTLPFLCEVTDRFQGRMGIDLCKRDRPADRVWASNALFRSLFERCIVARGCDALYGIAMTRSSVATLRHAIPHVEGTFSAPRCTTRWCSDSEGTSRDGDQDTSLSELKS